jgi:Mrp family chromosome partitioning ATPase
MTEQTKIPLPAQNDSLIERAVESFGWGQFAPRPVNLPVHLPVGLDAPRVAAPPVVEAEHAAEPAEALTPRLPQPQVKAPPARPAATPGAVHAIDREHLSGQGFIVPEASVTATLEEFRIVKRQLLLNAAELRQREDAATPASGRAQRVLICSPHPGEGKTYCAVNLALAMAAEKDSEVLLVDADFAKPSVLSALGLPSGRGLMDALADPAIDVAELVLATDVPGLMVLPAGEATNRDSEYLSSSRTAGVLDRLTQDAPHRIVIFDSPPALAASPAAELAKYAGQAVIVCRADQTGQQSLEDAISLLSGCPNIQLLLNGANFSPSGRRFGAYYGDGA